MYALLGVFRSVERATWCRCKLQTMLLRTSGRSRRSGGSSWPRAAPSPAVRPIGHRGIDPSCCSASERQPWPRTRAQTVRGSTRATPASPSPTMTRPTASQRASGGCWRPGKRSTGKPRRPLGERCRRGLRAGEAILGPARGGRRPPTLRTRLLAPRRQRRRLRALTAACRPPKLAPQLAEKTADVAHNTLVELHRQGQQLENAEMGMDQVRLRSLLSDDAGAGRRLRLGGAAVPPLPRCAAGRQAGPGTASWSLVARRRVCRRLAILGPPPWQPSALVLRRSRTPLALRSLCTSTSQRTFPLRHTLTFPVICAGCLVRRCKATSRRPARS